MTLPTNRTTVQADLRLEIDGRPVAVTGDGDHLRVEVSDPAAVAAVLSSTALPAGLPRASVRGAVRRAADVLAASGVTVTVVGPAGRLVTLGARARTGRATRFLTGTEHLDLGAWSAVGPSARPVLASAWQRLRATVVRRVRQRLVRR
ncbi:hypothetical protein ACXR2U_05965 [Jatrophihabitans sp. YIM 134969]